MQVPGGYLRFSFLQLPDCFDWINCQRHDGKQHPGGHSKGGAAVSRHHKQPPVLAVRQHPRRNAEQQGGQERQQAYQRHIRRAARLPEDIDPKAKAGQAASDGGYQLPRPQ